MFLEAIRDYTTTKIVKQIKFQSDHKFKYISIALLKKDLNTSFLSYIYASHAYLRDFFSEFAFH